MEGGELVGRGRLGLLGEGPVDDRVLDLRVLPDDAAFGVHRGVAQTRHGVGDDVLHPVWREHQAAAERRQLWHDPLTNEQHFGLVATDSAPVPDSVREVIPSTGPVEYVVAEADASYLHLDVTFRDGLPSRLVVSSDTVTTPAGDDYRVELDLSGRTGQAWVREELDPLRLDTDDAADLTQAFLDIAGRAASCELENHRWLVRLPSGRAVEETAAEVIRIMKEREARRMLSS